MANMTDSLEKLLLDGLLGVTPYTTPTNVYMALFTANPTDTGSVTNELTAATDPGYTRQLLTGKFSTATSEASSNTAQISWATATGDWSTVTYVGIMVGGTEGVADMLLWGALAGPVTILNTEIFVITIGNVTLTLA